MSKTKSTVQRPASKTCFQSEKPVSQPKENEQKVDLAPSNNFLSLNPPADAYGSNLSYSLASLSRSNAKSTWGSNQVALQALKPSGIQAKLKTDTPGDSLEQEADLVADQISQMADPHDAPPNKASQPSLETPSIQRKVSQSKGDSTIAPPEVKNALNSPGQALDSQARSYFEPRFKRDFSRVRVHTDQNAENATDSIQAKAFTHGRNIVFGKNQYAPSSAPGRRLLAHELTHVVQQSEGRPALQRQVKEAEEKVADEEEAVQEPPKPAVASRPEVQELDYAFFFAGGDYGKAAKAFIKTYYPEHKIVQGTSFEQMFDRLYQDLLKVRKGRDAHLHELIIVTHANAAGGLKIPLTRGDAKRKRFFNIWDLADLQKEFRGNMHKRFRERRKKVVAELIDRDTSVIVRGCEFGQSQEALDALRAFFGGQPRAWAPEGFQGYETLPIGKSFLKTPEQAFDFLMEQEYLPLDLQPMEDESKKKYIARVFGLKGAIPADFFVMGPEAYKGLKKKIKVHQGTQESAEKFKTRGHSDAPSLGKFWALSSPSDKGEDTELDPLSIQEIEARARKLNNPYRPQNASMLRRLADAWDRKDIKLRERNCDKNDPLCGLKAPSGIFGDSNITANHAERFPGPPAPVRDLFEDETMTPPSKSDSKKTDEFTDPLATAEGEVRPAQDPEDPLVLYTPPPAPEQTEEEEANEAYKRATNFDKSEGRSEPPPKVPLEEMTDAELQEEYKLGLALAKRGDKRLLDAVENEILRRITDDHPKFGTAIPRGLTPGQPANAGLTPDVFIKMLENIAEGKNPYGSGKGNVAWFITEGDPYAGQKAEKGIKFKVELTDKAGRITITSADLERIYSEVEPGMEKKLEAQYRKKAGISSKTPLSNTARKKISHHLRKATENAMWDRVAEIVHKSKSGVGEVILENSRFSQHPKSKGGGFRNGRYTIVRDMKHIRVKGGAQQILDTMKSNGIKADPTLTAAGQELAKKQKWAGRVRGAFRVGGKILLVVAIANDTYRIVTAKDRQKEVVNVAGGWAGALAAGAIFAEVWTPADAAGPVAWAIHGVGTLVAGGIGYYVGSETTAWVYEITVEDDSQIQKLE
ncbi:MAG: DUF4157 domain-containing protein [Candidatus Nitronauta litoralis]|uniref:DUF4157 domain-containing protein n=1 Tax=Candidatus Nitronauta litoralis TaxID=2705533 RepID=A0A7T0BWW9_9BACT|nr:MAG: DUF4157 domain-containing protein [Candidatus Nitronauta litoralis]